MSSPARRHRERALALAASKEAAAQKKSLENVPPYELMLARLDADKRRLHQLQSIQKKIELKRELLPEYEAWIDGALEADSGVQDDVLMTILVWCIDTGDAGGALKIGEYALKHDLKPPAPYTRTLACLLADEFADNALKALVEKRDVNFYELAEIARLTNDYDMPDEARAKLAKAIGLTLEPTHPKVALAWLKRAFSLHSAAGVKKDIGRLERAIKNKGAENSRDSGNEENPPPPVPGVSTHPTAEGDEGSKPSNPPPPS
ncbi:MAG: terminase [Candidatus Accumulibacter sp.]|jgi:hypothetical protein|nr:terminase [Accumulibacter sp.]